MRKIQILIMTIILLFLSLSNSLAIDLPLTPEKITNEIIKSLNEEPDNWFISNTHLIYAKKENIKYLKNMLYPENDSKSEISIHFSLYSHSSYVKLEKPFDEFLYDDSQEKLMREIKIFLYKTLKKDIGNIADKRVKVKKVVVIKVVDEKDGKKLKIQKPIKTETSEGDNL